MRDESSSHRPDPTGWLRTYDRESDGAVFGTEPCEDLPLQFSKTSGLGLLESTLENSPDTHGFPKLGPEPLVPDIVQLRVGDDHAATHQPARKCKFEVDPRRGVSVCSSHALENLHPRGLRYVRLPERFQDRRPRDPVLPCRAVAADEDVRIDELPVLQRHPRSLPVGMHADDLHGRADLGAVLGRGLGEDPSQLEELGWVCNVRISERGAKLRGRGSCREGN